MLLFQAWDRLSSGDGLTKINCWQFSFAIILCGSNRCSFDGLNAWLINVLGWLYLILLLLKAIIYVWSFEWAVLEFCRSSWAHVWSIILVAFEFGQTCFFILWNFFGIALVFYTDWVISFLKWFPTKNVFALSPQFNAWWGSFSRFSTVIWSVVLSMDCC